MIPQSMEDVQRRVSGEANQAQGRKREDGEANAQRC